VKPEHGAPLPHIAPSRQVLDRRMPLDAGRKGYNASRGNAEVLVDVKDYTQLVGAIVTNLQALETVLRYHSMGPKASEVQFPTVRERDAAPHFSAPC
jgi:hypothetical protein